MAQAAIQRSKTFKEWEETYSYYRARFHDQSVFFVISLQYERRAYAIKYITGDNDRGLKDHYDVCS